KATILLTLPYDVPDDNVNVVIERSNLIAGVRGEPPLIKGRLYGQVDPVLSDWLLEPSSAVLSVRERTASTTSTTSTQSSFAIVSSDPDIDITSSFAASLASGATSDADDFAASPSHSSPHSSADERVAGFSTVRRRGRNHTAQSSRNVSPPDVPASLVSSHSSFGRGTLLGRLLTVHLEKVESAIWPALVVGPAPPTLDAPLQGPSTNEQPYNMDPTSLALVAFELADVRDDRDGAFEFFLRAWLHARAPSAAMRLVSYYVPLHVMPVDLSSLPEHDRTAYCVRMLGGVRALAQLYLDAGLMHLEGTASALLSSSHSPLASIRIPERSSSITISAGGAAAWRRDREAARRYFERARALAPDLDVPLLLPESDVSAATDDMKLEMPSVDVEIDVAPPARRHKEAGKDGLRDTQDSMEWYLYIPGLIGAGTALLVVGIVGAIGFSSWRRNQS
ncbi:hypothetical protein K488DRAFT_47484, partial [Vararia minispora EC-137]